MKTKLFSLDVDCYDQMRIVINFTLFDRLRDKTIAMDSGMDAFLFVGFYNKSYEKQ